MTRVRRFLRVLVYGLAACTLLLLVSTAVERVLWRDRVLPGVRLAGVSVSGKSAGATSEAVDGAAARLEREPLEADAAGVVLRVEPRAVGFRVDRRATSFAVRMAGRSGNPVAQVLGTVARIVRPDEVAWSAGYDRAALERVLDDWARRVFSEARDGGVGFDGARVVPMEPREGRSLDRSRASRLVVEALMSGRRRVRLPVRVVAPAIDTQQVSRVVAQAERLLAAPLPVQVDTVTVTLQPPALAGALRAVVKDGALGLSIDNDTLHRALGPDVAALEHQPRDADFAVNGATVSVVPAQPGRVLDLDGLASSILAGTQPAVGHLRDVQPQKTTEWAQSLHITEQVSTFTTNYPAGQDRVKNIHRAADIMQNRLIQPGEKLSLNQAIGRRTPERGFVVAPVIYAGEFTDDVGGGVSQFATTFYNAVFFGGYPILEHQAHSLYISRYPLGREATLSWPKPDLVFVNDTQAGILVRTGYTATSITVTFYGSKEGREVRAEGPEILGTIDPPVEYVDDPTLAPGTEKVKDQGRQGMNVRVVRVISKDGKDVKREVFSTHYTPMKKVVARAPQTPTSSTPPGAPTSSTAGTAPTTTAPH